MADIAILVAEEYERRMKNPTQVQEKQELQDLASGVSISATATSIRMKKMMEMAKQNSQISEFKWVFEPKSQIGRAASTGFFSA
ncbi:uncharacterized protein LOC120073972 [Benincasa hispida]|uniref:uncharacterized protein LOC120073972 n=1 Tax=Benincasa hispida TaxID=102211 RepID=UPI0019026E00|nr:uncharacterized protein LOC120073972 [Benincasa hispida]